MNALDRELQTALELAQRCGAIALRIQAGGAATMQTEDKPDDQGPVTRADLAVETEIVRELRSSFPNDAILAEEGVGDHIDHDWRERERVWMIDPVDGTRDFSEGSDDWAIHIGLCIEGRPALGVVHEPGSHRTSWAIAHGGTKLAWTRCRDSAPEALHGVGRHGPRWQLVSSKNHRTPRIEPVAELLGINLDAQLRIGSTGVKIALVARGGAGIYAHPSEGTKLWDTCAPQVLLMASGGKLTDMLGVEIDYASGQVANRRGLLATAQGVDHEAIVATVRPLAESWFG